MTPTTHIPGLNFTPHDVTVQGEDATFVFPATGVVARVASTAHPFYRAPRRGDVPDECPVVEVEYGDADLPLPFGSTLIVSTMFADAFRRQHGDGRDQYGRATQLYVPDSGPTAIRENGQVVAVRRLIAR